MKTKVKDIYDLVIVRRSEDAYRLANLYRNEAATEQL